MSPTCPAPHGVPGELRYTMTAPSSLVLPTPVLSEVPSLAWPTIPFHRAPQGPQRRPTGCWIPWAQTNNEQTNNPPPPPLRPPNPGSRHVTEHEKVHAMAPGFTWDSTPKATTAQEGESTSRPGSLGGQPQGSSHWHIRYRQYGGWGQGCIRRGGGAGRGVLKGWGGGGFGWDPPRPRVPLWSPPKTGQNC